MPIATTILNGFLGAGKTTLMQSLLVQSRDLKNVTLGVIVNEMSTLDVDGSVLDTSEVISRKSPHFASIPGKSISSDEGLYQFRQAVERVLADEEVTHLLIETSGSTHPWPLLEAIRSLPQLRLHGFLSVVDTVVLQQDHDLGRAIHPVASENLAAKRRGVANLLAEQVMFANRLLLSKSDKVSGDVLRQVAEAVHPLNPHADILAMQWGNLSLEKVLSMPLYDYERVKAFGKELTKWEADNNAAPMAQPETYQIGSRVLRDPRPFHPQRLYDIYTKALGIGIYRSKGFFWLPTRDDLMLLWNQTGGSVGLEIVNYWKVSTLEDDSLNLSDWEKEAMRAKLTEAHADFGDRRCQLTVIGDELELDKFVEALQDCFCTDDEIAAWKAGEDFADPWPKTVATLRAQ
ncbi:GTP-binding protein [Yoonia sp. GPGPB17]|uniref:CobW family GTP-binding protein n=1 Tax=Yoonia sp. GPGPB17 TaxID=3026147 RepID=UPI0030BFCA5F